MKRLTGTDAVFLSMETPSWHQHVAGLTIIDPGDRGLTFDQVVTVIGERLAYAPKFKWKLKTMPLHLDRPMWVDDADFDVLRHVRRTGVPSPGGPRELGELAGTLCESQLDRRRPLWEIWYIEGLADGKVALLMKYHHCLLDGVSGASLATALLDIEPDPAPGTSLLDLPTDEEVRAGDAPWDGQLLVSGLANVARGPLRMARFAFGMAAKGITMADTFRRVEGSRAILRAPKTPFNEVVGPRRELAFASVSLSDVRALRKAHDVKVNDVVLSIVGGAFRTYLEKLGELPEMPLVTGVPVSTRAEGDATQDNQISTMFVSLGTDVADPVARLKAIHTSTQGAKEMQRALGARQIQSIGEVASPLILSSAIRAIYRGGLMSRSPLRINTLVSNVPGPPIDLYMCGAKITGIFPCSVILEGMGINVTVISYGDRLDFGLHVDPDLVPDPWLVANAVPEAMAELMAASGLGSPTPVVDPFAPTRRTPAEPAAPAVETASAVTGAPAVARPRATTRKMSALKAGA